MAKRQHAKFGHAQVESALEDVLTQHSRVEDWNLFLAWPINDPYLESVRQRCLRIAAKHVVMRDGEYMTKEGLESVREILEELRSKE
jgi:hypothetical protein